MESDSATVLESDGFPKGRGPSVRLSEPLFELVRSGREEDFRWLARSRGMPEERINRLWNRARTWLAERGSKA